LTPSFARLNEKGPEIVEIIHSFLYHERAVFRASQGGTGVSYTSYIVGPVRLSHKVKDAYAYFS
jgi:hypothetical protein